LGPSMWLELEWTALYNNPSHRKGKAAFELFVLFALRRYSPDISLQDALYYVTLAALSGYGPAFVVGRRLFLANDLPVPDAIEQGPHDGQLRQHIEFLEGLPNEKYYCSAVRIFWSTQIRERASGLMSRFCANSRNQSAMNFMEWVEEKKKEMDCAAFKTFATENFLLHQAVADGCYLAVDFLLRLDCDINVQTPDGVTPLHLSCRFADVKIIYQLVGKALTLLYTLLTTRCHCIGLYYWMRTKSVQLRRHC